MPFQDAFTEAGEFSSSQAGCFGDQERDFVEQRGWSRKAQDPPYKACGNTCGTRVHSQCTHISLTSKKFKFEMKCNYFNQTLKV